MSERLLLILVVPLLSYTLIFFYAPLAYILYYSLGGPSPTLTYYLEVFTRPEYLSTLAYSAVTSVIVTLSTLIIAYPAAAYTAIYASGRERMYILVLMVAPFWVDVLLRSIALRSILYLVGIREGYVAMIIGMVYEFYPFMFLALYLSMSRIEKSVIDAARSLGASTAMILARIVLPASIQGAALGGILVGMFSFTEYVVPSLLGGTRGFTAGSLLYHLFLAGDAWEVGSAITVVVTLLSIATAYAIFRGAYRGV